MENYKDLVKYRVFKIDQGQLFSTQNSKSNVYNVLTFTKIQLQYFAQALEIIRRCKHNMQQMLQKLPFSQISVKIGEMSQHLGTNRELHDSVFWWLFICNSQYFPGTFQTQILYRFNSMQFEIIEPFPKILLLNNITTMADPVNVLMSTFPAHEMSLFEFSPRGCLF